MANEAMKKRLRDLPASALTRKDLLANIRGRPRPETAIATDLALQEVLPFQRAKPELAPAAAYRKLLSIRWRRFKRLAEMAENRPNTLPLKKLSDLLRCGPAGVLTTRNTYWCHQTTLCPWCWTRSRVLQVARKLRAHATSGEIAGGNPEHPAYFSYRFYRAMDATSFTIPMAVRHIIQFRRRFIQYLRWRGYYHYYLHFSLVSTLRRRRDPNVVERPVLDPRWEHAADSVTNWEDYWRSVPSLVMRATAVGVLTNHATASPDWPLAFPTKGPYYPEMPVSKEEDVPHRAPFGLVQDWSEVQREAGPDVDPVYLVANALPYPAFYLKGFLPDLLDLEDERHAGWLPDACWFGDLRKKPKSAKLSATAEVGADRNVEEDGNEPSEGAVAEPAAGGP